MLPGWLGAIGTLGSLGLNWMGMRGAEKAQNRANTIYQQELNRRNALQSGFMQNELSRLDADRLLQESALDQIMKLVQAQQAEISPIREDFLKGVKPYFDEQQLYLKDPATWQKKQDEMMLKSPYASKGVEGEGRAYMAAKANPYSPSSYFTDAAKQAWSDAIRGFNDDRTRRQKQALEAANVDYQNKVSDVGGRYSPKIDYIKDILGLNLGHSERIGQTSARALGYGMDNSREAADIGSKITLGKGQQEQNWNKYFGDILKDLIPEQTIEGYSDPQDFILENYYAKELGLDSDKQALLKALFKKTKKKKIPLIDIINNEDLFGKKDVQ